jgi:hypothetical protein
MPPRPSAIGVPAGGLEEPAMSSAEQIAEAALDVVDIALDELYDMRLTAGEAAAALVSSALRELKASDDLVEALGTYRDLLQALQADLAERLGEVETQISRHLN